MNRDEIGVVVLAAGVGRRFGSDKRRALVDDQRSILDVVIDRVLQAQLPIRLCIADRESDRDLSERYRAVAEVQRCRNASRGMGSTLAEGIAQCGHWRSTLVMLADLPWVCSATITRVANAASDDRIIIPRCEGRSGHPVAFGRRFYPRLSQLTGEEGARRIIHTSGAAVYLDVDDAGIFRDVDHRDDLP